MSHSATFAKNIPLKLVCAVTTSVYIYSRCPTFNLHGLVMRHVQDTISSVHVPVSLDMEARIQNCIGRFLSS